MTQASREEKSYYYSIYLVDVEGKYRTSVGSVGNIVTMYRLVNDNVNYFINKFDLAFNSPTGRTVKNISVIVSTPIPGLNVSVDRSVFDGYVKAFITVSGKKLNDKNNFGEIVLILTVDSTTTTRGPGETTTTRGPGETTTTRGPGETTTTRGPGETTTTRGPTGQTTTTRGPTTTTTRRPTTPPPTTLQPPVTTTRIPRTTTTVTTTSVTTTVTTTVTTAPPTTQAPCPPCDS
jgi:hypothetical protein